MEQYVLLCENSIDGILTGVYEAYRLKKDEALDSHDRIHLMVEEPMIPMLCTSYLTVVTDTDKAQKVIRTLQRELGNGNYYDLCLAMVSDGENKADAVYHTIVTGLREHDRKIMERLGEDAIHQTFTYYRRAVRELNKWIEFLRFEELENGILYAKIGTKSDILSFLMPHFADRLPADNFIVYDETRGIFGLHPQYNQWYLVTDRNFDGSNLRFSQEETVYRELFTCFCEKIAITERINPELQYNMLPLWMRKYMIEFDSNKLKRTKKRQYSVLFNEV